MASSVGGGSPAYTRPCQRPASRRDSSRPGSSPAVPAAGGRALAARHRARGRARRRPLSLTSHSNVAIAERMRRGGTRPGCSRAPACRRRDARSTADRASGRSRVGSRCADREHGSGGVLARGDCRRRSQLRRARRRTSAEARRARSVHGVAAAAARGIPPRTVTELPADSPYDQPLGAEHLDVLDPQPASARPTRRAPQVAIAAQRRSDSGRQARSAVASARPRSGSSAASR